MASPEWNQSAASAMSFGRKGRVVTPAATDIDPLPKAVIMTTSGNITIVPDGNANSDTITFTGVPAGFIPPFVPRRVTACTGTCVTIDA